MTTTSRRWLLWAPRGLALAFVAFLSVFALDVFGEGRGVWATAVALAVHLVPAAVLLVVVAAAWRWEWIGGVAFLGAAVAYALLVARHHLDWILVISAPMLVVGLLFLWSWRYHDELHAAR